MSVLRTGVYANPDTQIWESAGGNAVMNSAGFTATSDGPIANLSSLKYYAIVVPAAYVGKTCRISISARIVTATPNSGTYASVMAGLQGNSVPPGGSSPTLITYGLQTMTTNNYNNGDMWFSSSIVIVPTGDQDDIGIYVYNRSGITLAVVEMQCTGVSIELIDTTPTYSNAICVVDT